MITIKSPKELAKLASQEEDRETGLNVGYYEDTVMILRSKGYSFGDIAQWLAEKTGAEVSRGRVYRVYKEWRRKHPEEALQTDLTEPEEADALARKADSENVESVTPKRARKWKRSF